MDARLRSTTSLPGNFVVSLDITIPAQFQDGRMLLQDVGKSEFYKFLKDQCPIPNNANILFPKQNHSDIIKNCVTTLSSQIKRDYQKMSQVPIFIFCYYSYMLNSNKPSPDVYKQIVDAFISFIAKIENAPPDILPVIIPLIFEFHNVKNYEDGILKLCNHLVEMYSISVFINDYLKFLDHVTVPIRAIGFLGKFLQDKYLSTNDIDEMKDYIENRIKKAHQEEVSSWRDLFKKISGIKTTQASPPQSPSRKANLHASYSMTAKLKLASDQSFAEILDELEITNDPIPCLLNLTKIIRRLRSFPDKRLIMVFDKAVMGFSNRKIGVATKDALIELVNTLNRYGDPQELYDAYQIHAKNPNVIREYLENCYTAFYVQSGKVIPNCPVCLFEHDAQEIREDLQFAVSCLNSWETSYDGIQQIWNILQKEPSLDLRMYIDDLDIIQKSYLIEGLRVLLRSSPNDELEQYFDQIENEAWQESKSERINRSYTEITEKLSGIMSNSSSSSTTSDINHDLDNFELSRNRTPKSKRINIPRTKELPASTKPKRSQRRDFK